MTEHSEDVFHHVRDSDFFEVPHFLGGEWHLPRVAGFQITKFMVLELVAAAIVICVFVALARRARSGEPLRGRFWNFWEMLALFIRDNVVRPSVGRGHHGHGAETHSSGHSEHPEPVAEDSHPADRFLPFIWTCFFFILISNLLGAIPWMGTTTGHLWVTGPLALAAFTTVIRAGCDEHGAVGFLKALVPPVDLPGVMKLLLVPMIWSIEVAGLLIKHCVLAIRLFANMLAGHTVIAVMLGFIAAAHTSEHAWMIWLVTPASILGQVVIGLLELFFAFVQAYVFSLLTSLFIGMAVNPH